MNDKVKVNILALRIIPNADESLRKAYGLADHERSIGLITTDSDDPSYVAIDYATKMAQVRVVYANSMFGGAKQIASPLTGEFIGVIAAPSPSDVKSGLAAMTDYLDDKCSFIKTRANKEIVYFAHCISRSGSYLSKETGVPRGEALAYLIASPLEALTGIDEAMKAADVRMVKHFLPPTNTNFSGCILAGKEDACRAACEAFSRTVEQIAAYPKENIWE